MSLLEGHGDVTMTRAAGRARAGSADRFARILTERRQARQPVVAPRPAASPGWRAKLNQYAAGERFIEAVEAVGGSRMVDICWKSPEQLPTLDEIRTPDRCGCTRRRAGRLIPAAVDRGDASSATPTPSSVDSLVTSLLARCTFPAAGTSRRPVRRVRRGPDSSALLVLAVAAGCAVTAIHVDHGLRAGSAAEADVVAATAARFGASFAARRRAELTDGPNLEAQGPGRALRRCCRPTCSPGTPPTTRPRRCCVNLLRGAARQPASRAMRPSTRRPLLAAAAQPTRSGCAPRWASPSSSDPSQRRPHATCATASAHELLPMLDQHRRSRRRTGAEPPGRPAPRRRRTCSSSSRRRSIRPMHAWSRPAPPAPLARRAVRALAARTSTLRTRPRSSGCSSVARGRLPLRARPHGGVRVERQPPAVDG